ncbi:MAG: hypothetical protein PUP92_19930 [Rhizonema sp. PD38]|nr:hypothetical protein [Rhizonema sp. PD38]
MIVHYGKLAKPSQLMPQASSDRLTHVVWRSLTHSLLSILHLLQDNNRIVLLFPGSNCTIEDQFCTKLSLKIKQHL